MAYELRDNQGSLFKNEKKQADSHADFAGTIKIAGKEYWLNAWEKQGKGGVFYSLSIGKEKTVRKPAADELP